MENLHFKSWSLRGVRAYSEQRSVRMGDGSPAQVVNLREIRRTDRQKRGQG